MGIHNSSCHFNELSNMRYKKNVFHTDATFDAQLKRAVQFIRTGQ